MIPFKESPHPWYIYMDNPTFVHLPVTDPSPIRVPSICFSPLRTHGDWTEAPKQQKRALTGRIWAVHSRISPNRWFFHLDFSILLLTWFDFPSRVGNTFHAVPLNTYWWHGFRIEISVSSCSRWSTGSWSCAGRPGHCCCADGVQCWLGLDRLHLLWRYFSKFFVCFLFFSKVVLEGLLLTSLDFGFLICIALCASNRRWINVWPILPLGSVWVAFQDDIHFYLMIWPTSDSIEGLQLRYRTNNLITCTRTSSAIVWLAKIFSPVGSLLLVLGYAVGISKVVVFFNTNNV